MRSAWGAAVVITTSLLVGACSDSGSPGPGPTASGPAPVSATSTAPVPTTAAPTPPALPPEAATADAAGAAAFVRHWFDLVNYAYATGDTAPLRAVSEPTCEACATMIGFVDDQYLDGGTFVGGQVTVHAIEAPAPDDSGVLLALAVYSQSELIALRADGQEVVFRTVSNKSIGFVLARNGLEWMAAGIGANAQ